ncbi:MAG: type II toxin-antitoxin system VapC family toxin [Emticicia sp.]
MKVFIDSSVLIEFENGRRQELLDSLRTSNNDLFINSIVVSEYIYRLLGILAEKSPMSVAESGKIGETLNKHETKLLLSRFEYLNISKMAMLQSIDFMKNYNLLPNDALILATCKLENIAILASFDSDFTKACQKEGIKLISKIEDL